MVLARVSVRVVWRFKLKCYRLSVNLLGEDDVVRGGFAMAVRVLSYVVLVRVRYRLVLSFRC